MTDKKNKIKKIYDIFENIDVSKHYLKIFIMNSLKSPSLIKYRSNIIESNELLEVMDLTQYLIASNSKFNKKISKFCINVINNTIKTFDKTEYQNKYDKAISKNVILSLKNLITSLHKFI